MSDVNDPTRPDPTVRTIETLYREVTGLRESTSLLVAGVEQILTEKFSSIDIQLSLIERQRTEQKSDTKTAVDAALMAQKEAVREQTIASERAITKSETATGKQLDQMGVTFGASIGGVTDLLNDLKDRIGKLDTRISNIEIAKQSVAASRTESRGGTTTAVAIISAVVAALAVIASVVIAVL